MSNDIVIPDDGRLTHSQATDVMAYAIEAARNALRAATGRPFVYTHDIAAHVLEGVQNGMTISAICKPEAMPTVGSVYRWMDDHAEFREAYTRARTYQSHAFADQALETPDKALDALQGDKSDSARVNAYRVKYEALKWRAGVHAPEYRDKQQGTGQSGMSVSLSISGLEKGKPIDIDVVGS